jgi:uncharacterized protein
MAQTWHDLLFAHWPTPPEMLRSLVPAELPLDTYDGQTWVAVAPFHMSGIRVRGLPAIPGLSRFPELNVRTYVNLDGKPGVYFFSLDVTNRIAVLAARTFYHLPYFPAQMSVRVIGNDVNYYSHRVRSKAEFRAHYRPSKPVQLRNRGTIEHWLTERYCLYTVAGGHVHRAEIHHLPWPLQAAEAQIEINTMAASSGIILPACEPLLHFGKELDVLIWPLNRIR